MNLKNKPNINKLSISIFIIISTICVILVYFATQSARASNEEHVQSAFAMSTIVTQNVYGNKGEDAASRVEAELAYFEQLISLYDENSDISKINENAGNTAVEVSSLTLALLAQTKELSLKSGGAFAATIAPLTLLWGVNGDAPTVPTDTEIEALLPLVDDEKIIINETNSTVMLEMQGQAIDLGGIAKGYACNIARDVYNTHGVESALLSIGGNVYVHGTKPGGDLFRIGFKNPYVNAQTQAIASVEIKDAVFSVSGGYERYFEADGELYHHIINPTTGYPSNSDVLSVGIIHEDGTVADFYSTTLFVQGLDATINYFMAGGSGMATDLNNNLYVSKDLEHSFELIDNNFNVIFIG